MSARKKKAIILGDSENLSPQLFATVITNGRRFGDLVYAGAIGGKSVVDNDKWRDISAEHGVELVGIAVVTTQNDAVDKFIYFQLGVLVALSGADLFIVASSDHGFAGVAAALQYWGKVVIGAGVCSDNPTATKFYRENYDLYIELPTGQIKSKVSLFGKGDRIDVIKISNLLLILRQAMSEVYCTGDKIYLSAIGDWLTANKIKLKEIANCKSLSRVFDEIGIYEMYDAGTRRVKVSRFPKGYRKVLLSSEIVNSVVNGQEIEAA